MAQHGNTVQQSQRAREVCVPRNQTLASIAKPCTINNLRVFISLGNRVAINALY